MSNIGNIFISYSRADEGFVADLRARIENAGMPVWVDTRSVRAGDEWRQAIDDAVASAAAVLIIISQNSINSQYVTYEWALARGLGVPLVPIRIDLSAAHPRLEGLQHFNCSRRGEEPWGDVLKHLREVISTPDTGAPPVNSQLAYRNERLLESNPPRDRSGNHIWLQSIIQPRKRRRILEHLPFPSVTLVLLGGTSLFDFYLRAAQSWVRQDGRPSLWSQAGVIIDPDWERQPESVGKTKLATVPLGLGKVLNPRTNGVEITSLIHFDNPDEWPNLAVIRFPVADFRSAIKEALEALQNDRRSLDLVTLARPWSNYSPGHTALPFRVGIPSAVFALHVLLEGKAPVPRQIPPAQCTPEWLWQVAMWWFKWEGQTNEWIDGFYKVSKERQW